MLLISSKTPKEISEYVQKIFGQTLFLPENPFLLPETAFHTDLCCCKTPKKLVCSPWMFEGLKNHNIPRPLLKGTTEPSGNYPNDILYNAAAVGNFLFCNEPFTDKNLLNHAKKEGMKILHVKQGYTKCSMIPVSEKAVITADKGIERAAKENGLDCLLTTNEGVYLNGFENGFLGGAAICGKDVVFFTGDLSQHPDYPQISEFCKQHNKEPVWVPLMPLYDLGSPIYL